MLTPKKKFCVFVIVLNLGLILRQILNQPNIFLIIITQVLLKFLMLIDLAACTYRLETVRTRLGRISHIGELMSYWLSHVVLSNTTQRSRSVSKNWTQKKKKN